MLSNDEQPSEFELCHKNDVENNSMKEFEITVSDEAKVKVLLVKTANTFSCLASKCSHYSLPLINGVLNKEHIRCFAHGACFNVKTGDIEDYPGIDCVPTFQLYVNENDQKVYLKASKKELSQLKRMPNQVKPSSRTSSSNLISLNQINNRILPKCLIIGSGAAGMLCLDTLREHGYSSNITMITRESFLPYDRPKLSKALNANINNIQLRDENYFKANNVNFFNNQEVDSIKFDNKQVMCKSGRTFEYDKLIIATGLSSIGMDSKSGSCLKGIFTLRTLEDSTNIVNYFNELKSKLDEGKKVNVVTYGGSFIAMEAISYFADKAHATVMSRRKPFETIFGNYVAERVQKLHESKGVTFVIQSNLDIAEFKESKENPGHLGAIKLNDGSQWPVDLFLLAIGGKPATEFLKNSPIKLNVNNYVYVDKNMRTNVPDVYAAGDITYFHRSCLKGLEFTTNKTNTKLDHVSIGHWGVASLQGRFAALSILNEDTQLKSSRTEKEISVVPYFWSVHYNKSLRFAGYNEKFDKVFFFDDKTKQNEYKFAAFYFIKDKCVGVCSLDWDPLCALFAETLYSGIEVRKEHIEKDPLDIKKLLA